MDTIAKLHKCSTRCFLFLSSFQALFESLKLLLVLEKTGQYGNLCLCHIIMFQISNNHLRVKFGKHKTSTQNQISALRKSFYLFFIFTCANIIFVLYSFLRYARLHLHNITIMNDSSSKPICLLDADMTNFAVDVSANLPTSAQRVKVSSG